MRSDEAQNDDPVRLLLPAVPEYGRLARVTAAGLAMRSRFAYAAVEDLRLALDEALIALLAEAAAGDRLELQYAIAGESLRITARRLRAGEPVELGDDARARFLLFADELLDDHSISPSETTLMLEKHRTGNAAPG